MQPDTRQVGNPALSLAVVCLGTVAAPLDSSVNIAFPSITKALGLAVGDIRWVIIAYVLTYASLMLVFGRLGDLIGYRRIFQSGLVIATAGFLACAAAPSLALLLPGRILQGIGIALTWSCAPALATSLYPEAQRTRVLALYGAVLAVGAALGPLAGGYLIELFGWPVVFWARAPLVVVALALSWLIPSPPAGGATRKGFDWTGAVLLVTGLASFLLAAARPAVPNPLPLTVTLLVAGAVALALFLRHERRHPEPIIRPSHFRDGDFLALNVASIVVNLAGFAIMLLVPFHLARTLALPPGVGGLILSMNAVGIIIGSWSAGRLAKWLSQGRLAATGVAVSICGLLGVGQTGQESPLALVGLLLLIQGTGLGLFQIAYTDAVLAHLPRDERGVAGSLTMVTRTIGVIGAATGLTALHGYLEAEQRLQGASPDGAFHNAFQATFVLVTMMLIAGLGLSLRRAGRRREGSAR